MDCVKWRLVGLLLIHAIPFLQGYTNEQDVYAINTLYMSLGSPPIPGWIPNGGDPCVENWQGVQCVGPNITAIILNGANLGGELGDKLANFASMITIDLSNNHIGGSIPENLPITLRQLFLSANQFSGSIPTSLSDLTLLSAMSLNNNHFSGELPDVFQPLTTLTNLDLSSNNLSGQLPSSMQSLSSLATMHIQNNELSGTLDVLQDLPLIDLNIENNLFSGPIPPKLFDIANFKKDGNPLNTTIGLAPPGPFSKPAPDTSFSNTSGTLHGPTTPMSASSGKSKKSSGKIVFIVFSVVAPIIMLAILIIVIRICFFSKWRGRNSDQEKATRREGMGIHESPMMEPRRSSSLVSENNDIVKVPKMGRENLQEYEIDEMGVVVLPPPPVDKVTVNPIDPPEAIVQMPSPEIPKRPKPLTSALSFSVASLQQHTGSFSEANLIRDDRSGKSYHADFPDGKQLVVLKLDTRNSVMPDDRFLQLVLQISQFLHPNIVELVGYCAEYGQRLLVYNYFSKRTLHDVLHDRDDISLKLSWNGRIQVALGAARALEYLHDGCQPAVVHQNFESTSVLINDELAVRVCDCGLASTLSSNSASQLSSRIHSLFGHEAPEISNSGAYTDHSDVYSFGVVMLELLTGREPYDSSRPRSEQYLVRWASSQLHDIDALLRMVDPAIADRCPVKSLSRFADIISRCIQSGPEFRPPMSEVVQDLSRMVDEIQIAK